jgi:peptidoglycan/xylan/chitin deacetylase (PgdA/CDA1 family)
MHTVWSGVAVGGAIAAGVMLVAQAAPATIITKWQDGRDAALAITYDDSTINQFRIAVPLMNERGLPGTFFVITSQIPGSRHMPTFVGRPIMEILKESETVPTNEKNVYERTSMLRYLAVAQRNELVPANPSPAKMAAIDDVLAKLRATGQTYAVGAIPYAPVRSEEAQSGRPRGDQPGGLSWDEMRKAAAAGHEIANHAVSHARMTILDEPNMIYEIDKAREELLEKMGPKHTFSLEAPYGIRDAHSRDVILARYDLVRNWVHPMDTEYMDGYMRGNNTDPASSTKPYLEWERGPVGSSATFEQMKQWVDTSIRTSTWLVLVIHGIEGLGYEPIPQALVTSYFDYFKANSDAGKLWVATYQDEAKYIRERMRANIQTVQSGQTIEVTVTHPLDPKKYDLDLTARTTVPAGWKTVDVRQGPRSQKVTVVESPAGNYVQYRITPNSGAARIEPAR